ncbi:hypothetical protein Vretifemale_12685 [Volvox reticuliferus]|uniref:Uncharacterized protein n=1 Tax=Volvox reticuliferus TaxID=1737510 RepID=A0A8J4CIX6_9CHLO|nr:hypothetical protein Vretifemale_12685 [Volvox reticuliferus]
MATPAASADGPPAVRSFVRRIGDRLEVKVPESKVLLLFPTLTLMLGLGFWPVFCLDGDPVVNLYLTGSVPLCLIPGLLGVWEYLFRRTWLVVGPEMWRAVSGWMMMSAPDPDRFVEGPFISHQKDGLVKDFISLTVTEDETRGLLFESTGVRFYFNPSKLQSLSRREKEWLAGKINDFMNEMKVRKHGQDGSIKLQTIQPWWQHVVDYSTLPESLRPVDSVGGFSTHIWRRGNRLDVITPKNVGLTLSAVSAFSIGAALIPITYIFAIDVFYGIIGAIGSGLLLLGSTVCFLGNIQGRWLVVDRYTWRLTMYWLRYPNIERDMARSQKWSDEELCGAFVDVASSGELHDYLGLRVQNTAGAHPMMIIHRALSTSTFHEAQWLEEEINKHIKMVKEHPATIVSGSTVVPSSKESSSALLP